MATTGRENPVATASSGGSSQRERTVVIGAGPAGLSAAWELVCLGRKAVIFEQDEVVGGISRTVEYKGYRFDIGGHRFFTKAPLVQQLWEELLGEELLERRRLSRIFYDDKFFDYPLKPFQALLQLGWLESLHILASYLKAQLFRSPQQLNFEQWVVHRFGRRLYEIFFKTYTEKVWGIPCTEIDAAWAAQRIKNLDLVAAIRNALLGQGHHRGEVVTTLIDRFHYPRLGPGQMWQRCRERLAARGVETVLGARVIALHHDGGRVTAAGVRHRDGRVERVPAGHFVSTMPIRELLTALDPKPPQEILAAAQELRYRDFLTVVLIVQRDEIFPDNWIYVHSPRVRLGRIQNFKNWSPDLVPEPSATSLGLEYFVQEGDELWTASDEELVELGVREMAEIGLVAPEEVTDATVVRMPKAYPVYDGNYRQALQSIRRWLTGLPNLQLVGRNGQHRYNNQDHSMLTGIYAARNIAGASYDVWSVNEEKEYHEGAVRPATAQQRGVPRRLDESSLEELLGAAFAQYDPLALGLSLATVAAVLLFLATAALLLQGGEPLGPNLSLLGQYLFGYEVSWRGSLVGCAEAGIGGFVLGYGLAKAINLLVRLSEISLCRRLELNGTLELMEGEGE